MITLNSEMRAEEFAQKLCADVAFNQDMFLGRKAYWFRPLCENLGWKNPCISDSFENRYMVSLLVVCVGEGVAAEWSHGSK